MLTRTTQVAIGVANASLADPTRSARPNPPRWQAPPPHLHPTPVLSNRTFTLVHTRSGARVMVPDADLSDAFDSLLNVEADAAAAAAVEGAATAGAAGAVEGAAVGWTAGSDLSKEAFFYAYVRPPAGCDPSRWGTAWLVVLSPELVGGRCRQTGLFSPRPPAVTGALTASLGRARFG